MHSRARIPLALFFTIVAATRPVRADKPPDAGQSPLTLARLDLEGACRDGLATCPAEVAAAQGAAVMQALKLTGPGELDGVLALRDALAAAGVKAPSKLAPALAAASALAPKLADALLASHLRARGWGSARELIAAREAALGARWAKAAHGAEARALEAVVRATRPVAALEDLLGLVDDYGPIVSGAAPDPAIKRAFGVMQARIATLLEPTLQGHLKAYAYDEAEALVATYAGQAGEAWRKRAVETIARRKAVSTELVDPCTRERTWEACEAALDELVGACSEASGEGPEGTRPSGAFTCNPTAKGALLQRFGPMLARTSTTDDQRLAVGRSVREVPDLKPSDALARLGAQALSLVRRNTEAAVRALAREQDYGSAKALAQSFEDDFGARWVGQMESLVDAEERRQIALEEARERAEEARKEACIRACMAVVMACEHDPWSLCHPSRETCELVGPMACGPEWD